MKIPLFGQTGKELYDDASYQLTQNWYVHINQDAKSKLMLYPTPALTAKVTGVGADYFTIRGMIEYGDKLYVVSGNTLYRIESNGAKVSLGTISTSSGRVSMAHNGANYGTEILIVDGALGYIYDSSGAGSLTAIASANFPDAATHCAFIDSFFIVNDPTWTGRWYKSAGYDGTTWEALHFATAERSPDALQTLIVSDRNIYLVGTHTTELWYNAGLPSFPFTPMQSGFMQWGTIAPWSVAETAGTVFWLSQNDEGVGQVIMTSGTDPQIISTQSIAAEITKLTTLTDAYSWIYQYQQHTFYVLTFPTDGKTFVYDLSTGQWHQWSTASTGYHKGSHHVYVYGKHYIGDNTSNKLYVLDWDAYTDDGDSITRIRRSANIINDDGAKDMRHYAVHIDIKEGVGNAAVADPQLKLRWRDNNGAWSNYHSRSMGKIGETNIKLIWRRLGRSSDRVYEISTNAPVPCVLIDSYAHVSDDGLNI